MHKSQPGFCVTPLVQATAARLLSITSPSGPACQCNCSGIPASERVAAPQREVKAAVNEELRSLPIKKLQLQKSPL